MIRVRNTTVFLVFMAVAMVSLVAVAGAAGLAGLQSLMINLPGWEAEPAEPIDLRTEGLALLGVSREYDRGSTAMDATLLVGDPRLTREQIEPLEPTATRPVYRDVDGFRVRFCNSPDGTGELVIFLKETPGFEALFVLIYEGLSEPDALDMARKFSWPRLKDAVSGFF